MDIIKGLQSKNDKESYQLLLQLETQASKSNALYGYFDEFIGLLNHKKSLVRTRGFRLVCSQAQWDMGNKIKKNLDILLCMLEDEKPTAVRQCLAALRTVVLYKPNLSKKIESKLNTLDLSKYKDSMIPLMKKDMEELQKYCCDSRR